MYSELYQPPAPRLQAAVSLTGIAATCSAPEPAVGTVDELKRTHRARRVLRSRHQNDAPNSIAGESGARHHYPVQVPADRHRRPSTTDTRAGVSSDHRQRALAADMSLHRDIPREGVFALFRCARGELRTRSSPITRYATCGQHGGEFGLRRTERGDPSGTVSHSCLRPYGELSSTRCTLKTLRRMVLHWCEDFEKVSPPTGGRDSWHSRGFLLVELREVSGCADVDETRRVTDSYNSQVPAASNNCDHRHADLPRWPCEGRCTAIVYDGSGARTSSRHITGLPGIRGYPRSGSATDAPRPQSGNRRPADGVLYCEEVRTGKFMTASIGHYALPVFYQPEASSDSTMHLCPMQRWE
ncbi:hypothetical protein OH77DRAFT_1173839 [Trametes cingulata]|nr:hypothetical protein OH77DRAFT_1173839 [Trametes cingulata]